MAKGNHSFTERDIHSRFNAIVGHTVSEVDTAGVLTASKAYRNKGRIGAVIEQSVLGYPADSDRRPDILIDGQPWEVKATGLVEATRGGWRAKEPMSITAVAPEGIVSESFTTSAFWHKAARLLVVYYLYVRPGRGVAVEYAGFEFKGYDLHTWREVDRCRLEADWTVVREFVRTARQGTSFETYRTDPSAGAEIRLPLTPAQLADELAREAEREGVEPKSLCLCGWKYLGRFMPFEWLPLNEIGTAEDANLLAAAITRDPDIDCDVLFQYCDLREIFEPLGYINVALQYDALPYRKWSNPLDLKEIGMDDLSLHEKCALQLGWELAGKDDSRDRADMSVDELIDFGESEAENRDLVVWLHGYMDPYEGEIDTARYSKEYIIESCEQVGFDIDFSRLPEPEESLDDMARAAESALEEKRRMALRASMKRKSRSK